MNKEIVVPAMEVLMQMEDLEVKAQHQDAQWVLRISIPNINILGCTVWQHKDRAECMAAKVETAIRDALSENTALAQSLILDQINSDRKKD